MRLMKAATLTAAFTLIAWTLAENALRYRWEFSCTTDTECEYEDDVRARVMGETK